jgi:hypothetical protein
MTGYRTKQKVPALLHLVSFIQKMPFRIVALLIFCCSSHIGCSSSSNSPQLERLSREDVILEEVRGHPTEFTIALGDQMLVWRRLYLLGTQYLNTDTPQTILAPPTAKGFHLKHAPSHLKNTPMDLPYEVIAKPTDTGELQVQVRTAESRNGPMLIARNIARFLQTGTLERSLFPDRQL